MSIGIIAWVAACVLGMTLDWGFNVKSPPIFFSIGAVGGGLLMYL